MVVRVTPDPVPSACPEPAYSLYSTDSENQVMNSQHRRHWVLVLKITATQFVYSVGLGRARIVFVGVGWDRNENPPLCHPLTLTAVFCPFQVTNLHKGLDRCAALLSGILQAEKAGQTAFNHHTSCPLAAASLFWWFATLLWFQTSSHLHWDCLEWFIWWHKILFCHNDIKLCLCLCVKASPSPPRAVTGGAAKSRPSTSLGKKTLKKLPKKTGRCAFSWLDIVRRGTMNHTQLQNVKDETKSLTYFL